MKPKIAIPLGIAGMFVTIATSAANANGWFAGHPQLPYWLYGAALLMLGIAIIGGLFGVFSFEGRVSTLERRIRKRYNEVEAANPGKNRIPTIQPSPKDDPRVFAEAMRRIRKEFH